MPACGSAAPDSPHYDSNGQLPRYKPDEARKRVNQVEDGGANYTANAICIPTAQTSKDIIDVPLRFDQSGKVHRARVSGLGRPSPILLGQMPTAALFRTK